MLPPEELTEATEWLMELTYKKQHRNHFITVKRRGRGGVRFGKSYNKYTHTQIKFETLLDIVKFDTNNCYFTMGNTLLKQIWGVPMGSSLSPIIAILVCARREHYHLNSLGRELTMIQATRYMDDVLFLVKYTKGGRLFSTNTAIGLMTCYHPCMDLEITETGKKVNFLECEVKICKSKLHATHILKNHDSIINHGKLTYLKTAEYSSYTPKSNKLGTVIGTFCRIQRNCSTTLGLAFSIMNANEELTLLGYLIS